MTIDDLVSFFENNNISRFSANESGYQIRVQVPSTFKKDETSDEFTLFANVLAFHTGTNLNHSNVPEDAAKKAIKKLAYKPVLANFCEYEGERDFTNHDFDVDDDGNYTYYEKQVGCFTFDKPIMEDDEKVEGRKNIFARIAIPRVYTDAADIIERKGGTACSVELGVNAVEWDLKEKELLLTDIEVLGLTLLGRDPDNDFKEVKPGMQNAYVQLEDFSRSVFDKAELVDEITKAVMQKIEGKEGKKMKREFDDKNIDDGQKEQFVEDNQNENDTNDSTEDFQEDTGSQEDETSEDENQGDGYSEDDENNDEGEDNTAYNENEFALKKFTVNNREFEVSLSEIQEALHNLVNDTYSENDNDYYSVEVYQESKTVVMMGWWTGKYYKQSYKVRNDVYSLVGDRVSVKPVFVTADEEAELDRMRSNYSLLEDKIAKYESEPEKVELLNSNDYLNIADTKEFEELKNFNGHFNMSLDELKNACDSMLLNFAKGNDLKDKKVGHKFFANSPVKKSKKRYANLFDQKSAE